MPIPIRYRIIRSKLRGNPSGYIAQVEHYRKVTKEELAEEISRRGTTTSLPDINKIFDYLFDSVAYALAKGEIVETPIGTLFLTVQGPFEHGVDFFDHRRHRLRIRFIPNKHLYDNLKYAPMEFCEARVIRPNPTSFDDIATGSHNEQLTPNDQGRVIGADLKFDPDDPQQGVFFVAEDGTETRVRSVAVNSPQQLILLVPDLAPGPYRLVVRLSLIHI